MESHKESHREFYERRVSEIMEKYLKNIKECDQDPWKKKPWDKGTPLDKDTSLDQGNRPVTNDDVCNIFESD